MGTNKLNDIIPLQFVIFVFAHPVLEHSITIIFSGRCILGLGISLRMKDGFFSMNLKMMQ